MAPNIPPDKPTILALEMGISDLTDGALSNKILKLKLMKN